MERFLDFIYLIYFGSHIPIAILFDSQAILPSWIFPKQLQDVVDWYTSEYRDSMIKESPAWYKSFIVCEIFLLLPFSFVAIYAYWKGISKNRWIRIPMIVYSTHVVTALFCIYHHIFLHDFSKDELPGPKNMKDRVMLGMFYFPYFITPVILLIDCLLHPIYKDEAPKSGTKAPGQYTAYSGTETLANNLQILIGHIITKLVSNASIPTEVQIKSIRQKHLEL